MKSGIKLIIGGSFLYILITIGCAYFSDEVGTLADWVGALSTFAAVITSLCLSDESKRAVERRDERKLKNDGYYSIFQQLNDLKAEIRMHSTEYIHWKINVDAENGKHIDNLLKGIHEDESNMDYTLLNSKNIHSILSRWENNWQLKILAENTLEPNYISRYKEKYNIMITELSNIITSVEDENYEVSTEKIKPILDLESIVLESYKEFKNK